MSTQTGGADSKFLSAEELAVEAELRVYAARVAPIPSAAFVDRVVAAVERTPLPIAGRGLLVRATEPVHEAGRRLRVALAQVVGGSSIPLRVRIQAAAMLVVVALLITTGVALAAAGATSVVTWVSGPQAPAIVSQTLLPTPSAHPSAARLTDQPQRTGNPNATDHPGNGGKPSKDPGSQASNHPNGSDHPGNGGKPTQSPGSQASNHPNGSDHPGNGGKPTQDPEPTAAAGP
jgi:hypothetical protein